MQEDFVVFPLLFSFLGWMTWFVLTTIRRYKVAKLQAELSNKLIDKFGSSQELLSYVQTEQGKTLLNSLTADVNTPLDRINGTLQVAAVLTLLGCALLFLHWSVGDADRNFLIFGILTLALGIGFGLAAALSYSFSKSAGLLNGVARRE